MINSTMNKDIIDLDKNGIIIASVNNIRYFKYSGLLFLFAHDIADKFADLAGFKRKIKKFSQQYRANVLMTVNQKQKESIVLTEIGVYKYIFSVNKDSVKDIPQIQQIICDLIEDIKVGDISRDADRLSEENQEKTEIINKQVKSINELEERISKLNISIYNYYLIKIYYEEYIDYLRQDLEKMYKLEFKEKVAEKSDVLTPLELCTFYINKALFKINRSNFKYKDIPADYIKEAYRLTFSVFGNIKFYHHLEEDIYKIILESMEKIQLLERPFGVRR